jgi:hypothetical protein
MQKYKIGDELIDVQNPLVSFQGTLIPLLEVQEVKEDSYVCDFRYIAQLPDGNFRKTDVKKQVKLPFIMQDNLRMFSVGGGYG